MRQDDRHRYLMLCYHGGLQVPSWMTSDGTLCLLALTLPAYLPGINGIFLIEEPENGIHSRAVETVYQSLSSIYDTQVLLATHSPVIPSMVKAEEVLCFAKNENGETDIVKGSQYPYLIDWKGETNLGGSVCRRSNGMTATPFSKDLFILVADKDMEKSLQGIMERPQALGIRPVNFEIKNHPHKDAGCFKGGHDFVRLLVNVFQHVAGKQYIGT